MAETEGKKTLPDTPIGANDNLIQAAAAQERPVRAPSKEELDDLWEKINAELKRCVQDLNPQGKDTTTITYATIKENVIDSLINDYPNLFVYPFWIFDAESDFEWPSNDDDAKVWACFFVKKYVQEKFRDREPYAKKNWPTIDRVMNWIKKNYKEK